MSELTFSEIVRRTLEKQNVRCCEPYPRLHGYYGFHCHRFPIKGGITRLEASLRSSGVFVRMGDGKWQPR